MRAGLQPDYQVRHSSHVPDTLTATMLDRITHQRRVTATTRRWLRRMLAGNLEAA
jgi:hypothetical protein